MTEQAQQWTAAEFWEDERIGGFGPMTEDQATAKVAELRSLGDTGDWRVIRV